MMQRIKNGPVLFYCHNGVLYPTVMTHEQQQMFEMAVRSIGKPIKILKNYPQGPAVNILEIDQEDAENE